MTDLSRVPVDELRREAAALHQLLAGSLWGAELRPVKLGREASPLLRAFWEEVGWDGALAQDLGPPQKEASHELARGLLADYRSWGSPLQASALPASYRVVIPDSDGVGFAVTDESGGALDPPVIGLSADRGTTERIGDSYLQQAAYLLLHAAVRPWYRARLEAEPALDALAPAQPLPHLAPGLRRLTDDLYLLPRDTGAPEVTGELAIRSFEGLARWLGGAAAPRRLRLSCLPGHRFTLAASPEEVRAGTPGWPELEGIAPALGYRVGLLEGTPVVIQLGSPGTMACSRQDEGAVAAWLAARGWVAGG